MRSSATKQLLRLLFVSSITLSTATGFASQLPAALDQTQPFRIVADGITVTGLVKLLSTETGQNVALDSDFYVNGQLRSPTLTFSYTGSDFEEALTLLCQANDLNWMKVDGSGYVLSRFRTASFAVSSLHNVSFESGDYILAGKDADKGSFSKGKLKVLGGADSQQLSKTAEQLKTMLSTEGALVFSSAGVVTVRDRPTRVAAIKKFLSADEARRETVEVSVRVVQADVDETNSGRQPIDWAKGKVVHEWEGSGQLGSTLPFRKVTTIPGPAGESLRTGMEVFVTPVRKSGSDITASVYVKYSDRVGQTEINGRLQPVIQENETNATVTIPLGGQALVSGLSLDYTATDVSKESAEVTGASKKSEYAVIIATKSKTGRLGSVSAAKQALPTPVPFASSTRLGTTKIESAPCPTGNSIKLTDPSGVL